MLVTGFEPFGAGDDNPAEHAVRAVASQLAGIADLTVRVLPVEFAAAQGQIAELIAEVRPAVVVSFGLAAGRAEVTPERVALNLAEARIPDNAGAQPVDRPLVPGAAPAHFSTLPVGAMAEAVRATGVASRLSYTAGTFVCNAVMYAALECAARMRENGEEAPLAGFVHVPRATEPGGAAEPAGAGHAGGADASARGTAAGDTTHSASSEDGALPQALIDAAAVAAVLAAIRHAGEAPVSRADTGAAGAED